MKNKKILIYSLIVFILAGVIVVLLKGFNVDLMLRSHESIEYSIGKEFELKDIKQIAKEVFLDKKVVIRTIEVFDDAVSINALEITEDEKNNMVTKLNEKYGKEQEINEVEIISNPGIRLRQIFKPYIVPSVISIILISISYILRFKKSIIENWKKFIEGLIIVIFIDLSILSSIAIFRISITTVTIPILIFVTLFALIICFENVNKNRIKKDEK